MSCEYYQITPMDNTVCGNCTLFLETCLPIPDRYGYASTSECGDFYLCEGCTQKQCLYQRHINL